MAIIGEIVNTRTRTETANRSSVMTRDVSWDAQKGKVVTFGAEVTFDTTRFVLDANDQPCGIEATGLSRQVVMMSPAQVMSVYGIEIVVVATGQRTTVGELLSDRIDAVIAETIAPKP